jgi:hypothetical protein
VTEVADTHQQSKKELERNLLAQVDRYIKQSNTGLSDPENRLLDVSNEI